MEDNNSRTLLVDEFDKNFRALLKLCDEVLAERRATKTKSASNGIQVGFEKYKALYENGNTNPDDHFKYIRLLWDGGRDYVLNDDMESWLSGGDAKKNKPVKIHYGVDLPRYKSKGFCIFLGSIYQNAVEQCTEATLHLERRGASSDEYDRCYALIRPDAMRLHLLRLFRIAGVSTPSDTEALTKLITQLEKELRVEKDKEVVTEPITNGISGVNISNIIQQVASGAGLKNVGPLPAGIGDFLNGLVGNQDLMGLAQSIQGDLKPTDSSTDVVKKVLKQLSDDKVVSSLVNIIPPDVTRMMNPEPDLPADPMPDPGILAAMASTETSEPSKTE